MRDENYKQEGEPAAAFDWHHEEICDHAPYNQAHMVKLLSEGRFIIEGRQSGIDDAVFFMDWQAAKHRDEGEGWAALHKLEEEIDEPTKEYFMLTSEAEVY